jgi:hypothetical protein
MIDADDQTTKAPYRRSDEGQAIARWDNEGGAPEAGDVSARRHPKHQSEGVEDRQSTFDKAKSKKPTSGRNGAKRS